MNPRVFITRRITDAAIARVQQVCDVEVWPEDMPPPYEVLLEKVRGLNGLLCMLTDRIDGSLMDAAGENLKVISQMAVGYDNIDVPAARERGILIGNTPGVLTEATADLAMALLLASARRLAEGSAYIRDGKWRTWEPMALLGGDLAGATLGIIGFGRIGQAVARRAAGFDLRIIAYNPRRLPEIDAGVTFVEFDQLLSESDYVSLHLPLKAETRHFINRDVLSRMKPSAILINTARGGVIDQVALVDALREGVIARAALDVTDPEPLPSDHPLLSLPNALVVPHIGSATRQTREKMAMMAAENLIAGVNGQPLPNPVSP